MVPFNGSVGFKSLVGIGAPERGLAHKPTPFDLWGGRTHLAPIAIAFDDLSQNARLKQEPRTCILVGRTSRRDRVTIAPRRDDSGAASGEQIMPNPAFIAFHVADFSPIAELSGDLDRQARAHKCPADVVGAARADTHIGFIGTDGNKARQRKARHRPNRHAVLDRRCLRIGRSDGG